jgi:hypothetical protein
MSSNLENWVSKLSFGEGKSYKNLSFIPVTSNNGSELEFLTLTRAIKDDLIQIREVAGNATVPEITVINKGGRYVLIIDGDHLIGAKQNRIVNKTIIIPPESETRIPVSCTEQGRWHFVSERFSKSKYGAPSTIRSILKQKMAAQKEVWEDVEKRMHSFSVNSSTSSLEEVYGEIDSSIEEYKKATSTIPSQVGYIVFINGVFSGLDILGEPNLFSELYSDLINGYIMDAMYKAKDKQEKTVSNKDKQKIIEYLLRIKTKAAKSIGVEKRSIIQGKKVAGEFITFQRKPVHLAVFPK